MLKLRDYDRVELIRSDHKNGSHKYDLDIEQATDYHGSIKIDEDLSEAVMISDIRLSKSDHISLGKFSNLTYDKSTSSINLLLDSKVSSRFPSNDSSHQKYYYEIYDKTSKSLVVSGHIRMDTNHALSNFINITSNNSNATANTSDTSNSISRDYPITESTHDSSYLDIYLLKRG